ncbi:hypothetical protein KIPE111705_12010 [Kibdelosporangium persicum]|uniref:Thiazolylpeptide-type bacteriocin n=1 Tax=Kibdelosporangium persicum TaxID=2698649 RepID=A0ABX2F9U6_9PSEU|nr:hypothetical protein [Kibdelosporangium persicum]NRN67904.1 hypothetical protein [Kibdelosporangium persicum]
MSDDTTQPEPEEIDSDEVEAHSADVLGLQKLKTEKGPQYSSPGMSCSSCYGASC